MSNKPETKQTNLKGHSNSTIRMIQEKQIKHSKPNGGDMKTTTIVGRFEHVWPPVYIQYCMFSFFSWFYALVAVRVAWILTLVLMQWAQWFYSAQLRNICCVCEWETSCRRQIWEFCFVTIGWNQAAAITWASIQSKVSWARTISWWWCHFHDITPAPFMRSCTVPPPRRTTEVREHSQCSYNPWCWAEA